MKKIFISIAVVAGAAGLIYAITYKPSEAVTTTPSTQSSGAAATGSDAAATGMYKDGTYTSNAIQLHYGRIQVSVQVSDGKIAAINMLESPYDHQRSRQVADYATPILIKEAIAAQSSEVDAVSGATETSQGFVDTLQTALDQAKR